MILELGPVTPVRTVQRLYSCTSRVMVPRRRCSTPWTRRLQGNSMIPRELRWHAFKPEASMRGARARTANCALTRRSVDREQVWVRLRRSRAYQPRSRRGGGFLDDLLEHLGRLSADNGDAVDQEGGVPVRPMDWPSWKSASTPLAAWSNFMSTRNCSTTRPISLATAPTSFSSSLPLLMAANRRTSRRGTPRSFLVRRQHGWPAPRSSNPDPGMGSRATRCATCGPRRTSPPGWAQCRGRTSSRTDTGTPSRATRTIVASRSPLAIGSSG